MLMPLLIGFPAAIIVTAAATATTTTTTAAAAAAVVVVVFAGGGGSGGATAAATVAAASVTADAATVSAAVPVVAVSVLTPHRPPSSLRLPRRIRGRVRLPPSPRSMGPSSPLQVRWGQGAAVLPAEGRQGHA